MFDKRVSRGMRRSLFLLVTSAACAAIAFAATTPRPPAKVCVGSNCATTAVPSGGIKWNPGHYVWISGPGYPLKVQYATTSLLAQTAKDTNIAGIEIIFKWAELEGDTPGDYSGGFALVDGLLKQLAALPTPKHLIISVQERAFGNPISGPPTGLLPQYINNMPNGYVEAPLGSQWAGLLNVIARLDNPAVIDRLIALAQAYGNRYNSNPLVEMYVPMGESAVSGSAGLNSTVYFEQMQRLYTAAAQAWPNTLLRWQLNFAGTDQTMLGLIAAAQALPTSIVGGPDPEVPLPITSSYPAGVRQIQANMNFRGWRSGSNPAIAYPDLRGKIPWVGEYQGGYKLGAGYVLPADFGNYQINVMHATHVIYCYNTWSPPNTSANDPHKWPSQLAYIDSTHGQTYEMPAPTLK
jgi:hypothetical protein